MRDLSYLSRSLGHTNSRSTFSKSLLQMTAWVRCDTGRLLYAVRTRTVCSVEKPACRTRGELVELAENPLSVSVR